ncbi:MAG: glycosyl hydrolase family 88 [Gemmatimonadetes bacterium]|nr:glycosyl hydrolase family 88 [Gemmatimonadota bacterium]
MMLTGNWRGFRRALGVSWLVGLGMLAGTDRANAQTTRADVPRTILLRGDRLAESKRLFASGEPSLAPTFDALLATARAALSAPPLSVMQKGRVPSSGDKHDYMSMAPYFWPNPATPNGLPFVNRDGEMNPESRKDHDGLRLQQTVSRVHALAVAWYLTGDAKYADVAAKDLRIFFLDTATRMNPNLRFAQAVLGVTDGRSYGIIDTRDMPELVDAVRLLEGAPGWTRRDADGMTAWCRGYLTWLLESKNGIAERDATNNHGTFYDEQVAALALFVGDSALAKKTIGESGANRIASQIDADGKQKRELERTRPLHYTLFNLDAFTMLAEMGRHVGVDLWHYTSPGGGSIEKAILFVAPYADSTVKFPTPDIAEQGQGEFLPPLRRAASQLANPVFARALEHVPAQLRAKDPDAVNFPLEAVSKRALGRAAEQLRRTATALDPANGYPRSTNASGEMEQRTQTEWTSGFFAGMLWSMYQNTGAPEWRTLAERWTVGLESNKTLTTSHDLGFMIFDSFGRGFLLTGDPHYRDVVMQASRSLATRFNPRVGAIKSWDTQGATDARREWKYPVIVDNLMNLEMLFWAGSHGGDSAWIRLAERHALTSARAHVRSDGSTAHVALFDPATGALERTVTWQGYGDSSAWSRGQAWAIHGFSASYGQTRRPELLAAAQRTADWFIAHLPPDGVPYWDFRDPAIPHTERDASAAAIAASGLYDLARYVDPATSDRYRAAADDILLSLASNYMAPLSARGAILAHSTGARPAHSEVDVGMVYADYFFIEALLRQKGLFLG